jgi:4-amino-4-deoxy-L-arabinose transferase-like glycosyltransferase
MQMQKNVQQYWFWLIILVLLVNATGLLSPVLVGSDAYSYGILAKNIVASGNWIDLTYHGQPWLDKPHFPFWVTAASFKLFGISTFAYVLPGFIFNIIGACYTYRLAKLLYSESVGLLAALIYVTSLHLLLSSIDLRAEAYLLGEIMPAAYYWLQYDRNAGIKNLLLGALFTGLALMTKGLFVVVTIFSGLVISWIYSKSYWKVISPKWLIAYALSLLVALPEFLSLYSQFQWAGLSWYFYGSQFGRFFGTGRIVANSGDPFFFVHTFLWAFLPWSLVFIAVIYTQLRKFKALDQTARLNIVYLHASFWPTFIMFSATKFQLDHYTNIIVPFAAILCAAYLIHHQNLKILARVQVGLSALLLMLAIGVPAFVFRSSAVAWLCLIPLAILLWLFKSVRTFNLLNRCVIFPSLAIACVYGVVSSMNFWVISKDVMGYKVAQLGIQHPHIPIYSLDQNTDADSPAFYVDNPVYYVQNLQNIQDPQYYLLVPESEFSHVQLPKSAQKIGRYSGSSQVNNPVLLVSNQKFAEQSMSWDTLYFIGK